MNLPKPFDTFRLEKEPGEYKDFGVTEGSTYPLKGVTYPTSYGDIEGYTGEDGHPLDVFVGTGGLFGFFQVFRPDVDGDVEHKFLVNITDEEERAVLEAFEPVLRGHRRYESMDELLTAMEPFKNES